MKAFTITLLRFTQQNNCSWSFQNKTGSKKHVSTLVPKLQHQSKNIFRQNGHQEKQQIFKFEIAVWARIKQSIIPEWHIIALYLVYCELFLGFLGSPLLCRIKHLVLKCLPVSQQLVLTFLKAVQFNPTPDPNPDQTKRGSAVLLKRNVSVTSSQLQFVVFMDAQISQSSSKETYKK